jgi:hypothetical protein
MMSSMLNPGGVWGERTGRREGQAKLGGKRGSWRLVEGRTVGKPYGRRGWGEGGRQEERRPPHLGTVGLVRCGRAAARLSPVGCENLRSRFKGPRLLIAAQEILRQAISYRTYSLGPQLTARGGARTASVHVAAQPPAAFMTLNLAHVVGSAVQVATQASGSGPASKSLATPH